MLLVSAYCADGVNPSSSFSFAICSTYEEGNDGRRGNDSIYNRKDGIEYKWKYSFWTEAFLTWIRAWKNLSMEKSIFIIKKYQ